jgi:hypothetical protein
MPKRARVGPPDEPVELTRVGSIEAQIVVGRLRAAGIDAVVSGPGSIGNLVAVQFADGVRVMVRRFDLDAAHALLAEAGGDDAPVPVDDAELLAQAEAAGPDDYDDGARL